MSKELLEIRERLKSKADKIRNKKRGKRQTDKIEAKNNALKTA